MSRQVRIVIITDIHHHHDGPPEVLESVESFVHAANADGADILLDLGDRLRDKSRLDDRRALEELTSIFVQFRGRRLHLLGNHDVINLTAVENAEILGTPMKTTLVEGEAAALVAWQPDVRFSEPNGFIPAAPFLPELAAALNSTKLPTIVATHYPVSGQSMAGNRYFERRPDWAFPPDHHEVRRLLAQSGRCVLWLSGHIHEATTNRIENMTHVCLPSVSDPVDGRSGPAWTTCTVEDTIELTVGGSETVQMEIQAGGAT